MLNALNLCSALKNAIRANKKFVFHNTSLFVLNFLKKLHAEGFIKRVDYYNNRKSLRVELKYSYLGIPAFKDLIFFSTPGKLYNISYKKLTKTRSVGVFFVSTPRGILTDSECLKYRLGGIILCYIN